MKALLDLQDEDGFEEPIDTTGYTAVQNKALMETRSKDKAALYMLFQAVDKSGFEKIAKATTSKKSVGHSRKGVQRNRPSQAGASPDSAWQVGEHEDEGVRKCI